MALKSLTGKNPQPSAQASSVLQLHLLVEALRAAAMARELTPVVYEDGIYDVVDYAVHLTPGRASWHCWYESIVMNSKKWPRAAAAADFNISVGGAVEKRFMYDVAVPLARQYGIAYYCENVDQSGQHFHIDVGSLYNNGDRKPYARYWSRASWIGKPTSTSETATFPLPKGHWYGVDDHTIYSHSGVRSGDRPAIQKIQRLVGSTADGRYGPKTAAAVIRQQRATGGIAVDGKVRINTWKAWF